MASTELSDDELVLVEGLLEVVLRVVQDDGSLELGVFLVVVLRRVVDLVPAADELAFAVVALDEYKTWSDPRVDLERSLLLVVEPTTLMADDGLKASTDKRASSSVAPNKMPTRNINEIIESGT